MRISGFRVPALLGMLVLVYGCSGHEPPVIILDTSLDEASMVDFLNRTGSMNAHSGRRAPPAAALTNRGVESAPLAVVLTTMEPVLMAAGLLPGDRVLAVDDDDVVDLFEKRWSTTGQYKRAAAFATDKYTGFANEVFSRRRSADSVLLTIVRPPDRGRRSDNPEPDQYLGIRITFTD